MQKKKEQGELRPGRIIRRMKDGITDEEIEEYGYRVSEDFRVLEARTLEDGNLRMTDLRRLGITGQPWAVRCWRHHYLPQMGTCCLKTHRRAFGRARDWYEQFG